MKKKLLALIAVTGLVMSSWAVQPTSSAATAATAPPQSEFGYQFGTWAAYNLGFNATWTHTTQIFFIGAFGAIGGAMGVVGGPIGIGLAGGLGSV